MATTPDSENRNTDGRARSPETPVSPVPGYDENFISKLERLAKLYKDGSLSEEEFTVAKRMVLGMR